MRTLPCALFTTVFALLPGLAPAQPFECLIEPRQVVELKAPMEGLIERVEVDRGDFVKQGQVLAVLDTGVDRARLELARYKAQMQGPTRAALSRVEFFTKKLDRNEGLLRNSFVSAHERDEASNEKQLADAELVEARDNIQVARLEVREYEEILRLKTIRSPFDGVVMERRRHPGEVAQIDDQMPLLKLAQIDPLYVEVILPAAALGRIKAGTEARIVPETPVVDALTARVTVVDTVVDAASGTFGVRLELKNPDRRIPAGIRCQAEFQGVELPVEFKLRDR
jgi:RND family efflux transporter MFP subunit